MQHRIQRARRDVVAVAGQLLSHPRAVHWFDIRVVQDVQPHCAAKELAHHVIPNELCDGIDSLPTHR
jgi:hypothetical protein